jgi:predicted ester cyclase
MQDTGDVAVVDQVTSQNCIQHMPRSEEDVEGREGLKRHIAETRIAFPDIQHDIEDMVAEGDKVAARVTVRATHTGAFGGIAPTGKEVTVSVVGILRISEGVVVESWFDYDALGLMQQLGALS